MVALVTGAGLGLLDTSAHQLNGAGVLGQGQLGQGGGSATVNLATGNLVLQVSDESLSGVGGDLRHLRTYNAQGDSAQDSDLWRWLGEKRVVLSGTLNAAGSTVTRTTGDGHESVYTWNGSEYISSDGRGAHDTIKQVGGAWIWTEGSSQASERYSVATGWISSSRDVSGNGFDYTFSGNVLTRVSDAASGQSFHLVYDANNRLERLDSSATVDGAKTRQVYYHYDASGRLSSVVTDLSLDNSIVDGNTYTTSYTYDGSSLRVASVSQSDGTSAHFTYENVAGTYRVKTVTDQMGTTTFGYHANRTDVSNAEGETSRYYYDSQQRLTRVESYPKTGETLSVAYAYDADDNVTRVTDTDGNAINYTYDANGNLTKQVDALGNTLERTYNSDNRIVTETAYVTPSHPETSRLVYDTSGRLRFSVSAEGRVSETRYNAQGLAAFTVQYAGGAYDVSALSKTATLTEAQLTHWVASQDKTQTQVTQFEYDHVGNLSRQTSFATVNASGLGVTDNATAITEYVYSAHGQLLQTIAVTGVSRNVSTVLESNAYDGMGRLVSVVTAAGTVSTSYGSGVTTVNNQATGLSVQSAYDGSGRLLSVTTSGDGTSRATQYYYDDAGRLVMTEDAEGGRAYSFYDDAGRVTHTVSATGSVTETRYNSNGQVLEVIAYADTVDTSTWFNGTAVTQTSVSVERTADHRSTRYHYDDAGRVVQTVDEFGANDRVSTTQYDGLSRVTSSTTGNRTSHIFYDKDGLVLGSLNAEGHLSENVYDEAGRLKATIRYSGDAGTATGFAAAKLAVQHTDKLMTRLFYDAQGRQVASVNEQGFLSETVFNAAERRTETVTYLTPVTVTLTSTLSEVRGAAGASQTSTVYFDQYGRAERSVGFDGTTSRTIYDSAGRVSKTIAAAGSSDETAVRTRYNTFGEVTGVVSGVGEAAVSDLDTAIDQYGTRYQYDALGRKVSESGPQGQQTLYFYDASSRLTHVVNALGDVSETSYNAFGQIESIRVLSERISVSGLVGGDATNTLLSRVADKKDDVKDAQTTTYYNQLGLTRLSIDGEGKQTTYAYNSYGELSDVYRPIGTGTATTRQHMDYDKLGRVTNTYSAYGTSDQIGSRTVYDGFGRVSQVIDAKGHMTETTYLDQGRTIRVEDPLNRSGSTSYDAFGRELVVTDALGQKTRYVYDDAARKVTVTTPEGISVTTWSTRTGQTLKVQDGEGNITQYTYTKDGQVDTVTDAEGHVTDHDYDNSGRLLRTTDANLNTVEYRYDAANRVVLKAIDPDGLNLRTAYTFDSQGRQVAMTEGSGTSEAVTTQQTYDRNGRLTQVVVDPNGLQHSTRYVYDNAGQQIRVERGSVSEPAQQVVAYEFNALGRKTKETLDPGGLNISTHYRYDDNGNITRVIDANNNSSWSVYNAANQVTHTINAVGSVVEYDYDENGRQYYMREYAKSVNTGAFGDVVTSVSTAANSSEDRIRYTIADKDGRERFTKTLTHDGRWVVTENVLDANGNVVESRRFEKTVSNQSPEQSPLTAEQTIDLLQGLGYRDRAWGDTSTRFNDDTRRSFFVYDDVNRLRFSIDAAGYVTENVYDSIGNVRYQKSYAALPNALSGVYTEENVSAKLVAGAGDRIKEYRYDAANRLVAELSPQTTVTASNRTSPYTGKIKTVIGYNALGQVITRTEGIIERDGLSDIKVDQRVTRYEYDKAGNQIKTTLAGWYDASEGRFYATQANQSDRFLRTTEVLYDDLGNAVRNKISIASGQYVYQYKAYDAIGRQRFDVDTLGHVTQTEYDALGNERYVTRYSDHVTLNALSGDNYWSESQLAGHAAITGDTEKRVIENIYDNAGRKTATILPSSDRHYNAKSSGDNKAVLAGSDTYTASARTDFSYNAFGEVIKQSAQVDQTRHLESYTYYDQIGRAVLSIEGAAGEEQGSSRGGYVTATEYDALGNIAKVTEFANAISRFNGADAPQIVGGRDPKPASNYLVTSNTDRVQTFTYDAMGRTRSVTREGVFYVEEENGRWSDTRYGSVVANTATYNAFGEVVEARDALGNVSRTVYNTLGQAVRQEDAARDIAVAGSFDPFRHSVTESPTTSYTYNVFGQAIAQTRSADGVQGSTVSAYTKYDHIGNQISQTDPNGTETHFFLDVNGKTLREYLDVRVTDSDLNYAHRIERRYEYDLAGRQLTAVDLYDGKQTGTRQVYNAFGEVVREERIWGSAHTATRSLTDAIVNRYEYDDAGRVITKRSADGYTQYYYDLTGNATRQELRGTTNSATGQRVTEVFYDIQGRVLVQRQPAFEASNAEFVNSKQTPTIHQAYDRWGNVVSITDPKGNVTTYRYNYANQVSIEMSPETTAYGEDLNSYRSTVQRAVSFDKTGRAVKETTSSIEDAAYGGATNVAYGGPANTIYGGVAVTSKESYQLFDAAGNVTRSVDSTGIRTDYAYDLNGNRVGMRNGVGTVTLYTYDDNGQLTSQSVARQEHRTETQAHTTQYGTHYSYKVISREYNGLDNSQTAQGSVLVNRFKYDQAGRKYSAENAAGNFEYYQYDARNNLTFKQDYIGQQTRYTFDVLGNKVTEDRQVPLTYTKQTIDRYITTSTAEYGSTANYATRDVEYISGYETVSSAPTYGSYTEVYSTRTVEYIDGYKTTSTSQRGSTKIYGTRDVEYIDGYKTTSTEQRGSTANYATRDVQYISGYETVSSAPTYGSYTEVYSTRTVEYIDGYKTTSTSQRGSTAIYETQQEEYIYGYTTTSTAQRGSTEIYSTRQERYISHYTTGYGGVQTPVYAYRTVEYVSGYKTPIYETRDVRVLVGYKTPIYKTREEEYVSGYKVPVYSTRQEEYIKDYTTPIYKTREETYFTGDYKTPIYKTREEEYVSGYEVPIYSTRQEEYIKDYTTPVYVETIATKNTWVGDKWTYNKGDYTVGRLDLREYTAGATSVDNIRLSGFRYSYDRFGQLKQETNTANSDSKVVYEYYDNGLLKSKADHQTTKRTLSSDYKYDIRGLRTEEVSTTTDTYTYTTNYGHTTVTSNTSATMTTQSAYDELGRLTRIVSPSGQFRTDGGSRGTAELKHLTYKYDAWGNRRAVESLYRLTGSSYNTSRREYFAYDNEGRTLVSNGRLYNGYIVIGTGSKGGTAYEYDAAGRIASTEQYVDGKTQYGLTDGSFRVTRHSYNDLGLLTTVETSNRYRYDYDGLAVTHRDGYDSQSDYRTIERHTYDNRGFKTTSIVNGNRTTSRYRDDGQLTYQAQYNRANELTSVTTNYNYDDASGQLKSYEFHHYEDGKKEFTNTYRYYHISTFSGTQVSRIEVDSTQDRTATGTTRNYYDHRGRLIQSAITETNEKGDKTGFSNKYFAYNADGQIVGSQYKRYGTTAIETQAYFYSNGNSIANLGDEGVNITPIETVHQAGNTPGTYSINAGDTLVSIAQSFFGDGSKWYIIAEANALNVGPTDRFTQTDAGRTLRIPNTQQSLKNTSTSFKPYNAAEIIGDLSPSPEILPPPKSKGGCNIIATILIVVVAVVVTVFTAGAAAALGPTLAAFVGGAAGSLASQVVGVALGVSDGINLRKAFASGIAGALTAGIGSALSTTGGALTTSAGNLSWVGQAIQGAGSVAANAVANKIVGLDSGFSWSAVASGAIAGAISGGLGLNSGTDPSTNLIRPGEFGKAFGQGFANTLISSATNNVLGVGPKQSGKDILLDAFGNGLAQGTVAHFNIHQRGKDFGRRIRGKATDAQIAQFNAQLDAKAGAAIAAGTKEKLDETAAVVGKQVSDSITTKSNADTIDQGSIAKAKESGEQQSLARAQRQLDALESTDLYRADLANKTINSANRHNAVMEQLDNDLVEFRQQLEAKQDRILADIDRRRQLELPRGIREAESFIAWRAPQIADHTAIFGPRNDVGDYWGDIRDITISVASSGARFAFETVTDTAGFLYDLSSIDRYAIEYLVTGDFNLDGIASSGDINNSVKEWVVSHGPGPATGGYQSDELKAAWEIGTILLAFTKLGTAARVSTKGRDLIQPLNKVNVTNSRFGPNDGPQISPELLASRNATPAQRVAQNNINGNAVSDNIAARFPGSQREVRLETPDGGVRFVDVLTSEGLAIESKVGRTSLSSTVRTQAQKDIQLLNDPFSPVNSLRFEFSPSPITGKVGPTAPLENFLRENGFEIIIND